MQNHETVTDNEVVKAKDEVIGVTVRNQDDEGLGKISEIMLDKISGKVAYAVLESGSFLGIGGKLFAIPWKAFHYDPDKECFVLKTSVDKIKNAPGFDKDHWPNMSDRSWGESISEYYETRGYWE